MFHVADSLFYDKSRLSQYERVKSLLHFPGNIILTDKTAQPHLMHVSFWHKAESDWSGPPGWRSGRCSGNVMTLSWGHIHTLTA